MNAKRLALLGFALAIAVASLMLAALAFGSGGIPVTAADSPLSTPPPPVTATISTAIRGDLPGYQVEVIVCVENASATAWHLLYFGDEGQTGAEPYGWQMALGCTDPIPHWYEVAGQYDLEAHIVSEDEGTHEFTYELTIPERPHGELAVVKVGPESPLLYTAVVTAENAVDWGTCIIDWGYEGPGEVCFPGTSGTFTATHSVPTSGSYEVVLEVRNEVYLFQTSQTISFMPEPTGTLSLEYGSDPLSVVANLSYENTMDWGTCLQFGDGAKVCFPGSAGQAAESHTYPDWGTYLLTLTVENDDWLPVVLTETVAFERPADPTGTLEVAITDMATLAMEATGTFVGARPDWGTCLWWGDGPDEVVCFEGSEGAFSETHQYPAFGVYTPTLVIEGPEGTEPFSATQVVEFWPPTVLPPEVQLGVEVLDLVGLEVRVTGVVSEAEDWVLDFGDGQSIGKPGLPSVFDVTHVFQVGGVYTVTLAAWGHAGEQVTTTQVVDLTGGQPEPGSFRLFLPLISKPAVRPTCSITTNMVTGHLASTTVSWSGFPSDWSFLFWGDESQTQADPVGFWGPEGLETWSHVYNDGTWHQEVKILQNSELVAVCEHTVTIP